MDKSCILKCTSCRKCHFYAKGEERENINKMAKEIKKTNWLEMSDTTLAGHGEIFYSETYKELLKYGEKRKQISILSNGTLFNRDNWKIVEEKYEKIDVQISVDAATKETYKKLRGVDFENLLKNLEMLGELRETNKIRKYQFNFVVQQDNYKEMIDFVKLAQKMNVDTIQFMKLNNWGTFKKNEYKQKCLIIKDRYLNYDFYKILKNPIFKNKIVDISSFDKFIEASEYKYRV